MPKKSKKNKKYRPPTVARELEFKEDMQEYAKVIKVLGDRKLTVQLPDKTQVLAVIPGKFRKRVWIKENDLVVVSRRTFQETKVDVIYKYDDKEVKNLITYNEIPDNFMLSSFDEDHVSEDIGFVFGGSDSSDLDIDVDDI